MGFWNSFAEKHPGAAKWIREGGLFVIVSNVITVLKMICLWVLPLAFAFLGTKEFGFPGIDLEIFGVEFKWYIIGYSEAEGGLAYFTAYMISMFAFEVLNFFIQRKYVFRSNGNIAYQGMWYLLAFCLITCIVNSINCYWMALIQSDLIEAIGTTFVNGGVSMVVMFFVNKLIFPEGEASKRNKKAAESDQISEEKSN